MGREKKSGKEDKKLEEKKCYRFFLSLNYTLLNGIYFALRQSQNWFNKLIELFLDFSLTILMLSLFVLFREPLLVMVLGYFCFCKSKALSGFSLFLCLPFLDTRSRLYKESLDNEGNLIKQRLLKLFEWLMVSVGLFIKNTRLLLNVIDTNVFVFIIIIMEFFCSWTQSFLV